MLGNYSSNQLDIIPSVHAGPIGNNVTPSPNYGLIPVNPNGLINVNIEQINGRSISPFSNAIDVNIKQYGGSDVDKNWGLPVQIQHDRTK